MDSLPTRMRVAERRLLERAAHWPGFVDYSEITPEAVRRLAEQCGLDFATALLYDRIVQSPEHGRFIQRLESLPMERASPPRLEATLVIVPGAFYVESPHTGADGRMLREEGARLGCKSEVVPLASFGCLAENVRILSDWLTARPAGKVILASLSKGGAEVKLALARPDSAAVFRNVVCWVNLSGLLQGTPLAGWLLKSRVRRWWFRLLFWWRRYDYSVIGELGRGPNTLLHDDLHLPAHMQAIHLVGFPLARHLSNGLARRGYRRLRHLGPNDAAGIVLADVCRWPGLIYPVWGADHYLRPGGQELRDLARRLLCYIGDELGGADSPPGGEAACGTAIREPA
jgi:hypothetical protein